jgi:spermidine/putrescine transport system permease protein
MNKLNKTSYLLAIYLFLYTPILVLIVYSFNDSSFSLLWQGFTLRWYQSLLQNTDLQIVALHSLFVGVLAATGATGIGTLAAVNLYRYQFFGKKLIHGLIFILIVSPDIVTGISLLILFSTLKMSLGFWTLLLSHITFCIPFVTVTVYSRLVGQDKNLFEAAKDLGATEGTIFRRILIPLLWPAICAGWLLSFTLSLDDVIISFFVTAPDFDILPLKIFSMVRVGIKPEINALCSVMFGLTLIIALIYQLTLGKKQR